VHKPRGRAKGQICEDIFEVLAFVLRVTTKNVVNFFQEKVHPAEKTLATPMGGGNECGYNDCSKETDWKW